MISIPLNNTKRWLKQSQHPAIKILVKNLKSLRLFELPTPKIIASPLYFSYCALRQMITTINRVIWWTPIFKGRLQQVGRRLYLYGGLPYVSGPVTIRFGNDCRVSGNTTFSGRTCATKPPELNVGNNVDIGWMTTIAVGQTVSIGNNVRIAGRALLAGYPGHPLDAQARAAGMPETDTQTGDIILQDDVWLATGVMVMAGVYIGKNTIVAAGSVVTHDLPENVLAAGVPARVIRTLNDKTNKTQEQ